MSKTKMRCTTCGKWFQSANAKEVTCPECTQKIRKEKQAIKNAPPTATKISENNGSTAHAVHNTQSAQYSSPRPTVPPKPKPIKSGTNQWLDSLSDVKVGQPDTPQRPKIPSPLPNPAHQERATRPTAPNGPGGYRNTTTNTQGPVPGPANNRPNSPARGPAAYHPGNGGGIAPSIGQRPPAPRQSQESPYGRGPGGQSARKPWQKGGAAGTASPPGAAKPHKPGKPGKPAAYAKPKREKTPPPVPFTPSAEQIQQIEERYIVLAQPAEFDGIRSQIAKELNIPKRAIKKVIKDLRDRQHIPSWWELQSYKGSNEDLEQIKSAYQPYLPVPPVGVHKLIADQLHLKPGDIYQAIKSIRLELNLPQYNDPQLHKEAQVTSTESAETGTEQPNAASGESTEAMH